MEKMGRRNIGKKERREHAHNGNIRVNGIKKIKEGIVKKRRKRREMKKGCEGKAGKNKNW